jgi:hypothetical protein
MLSEPAALEFSGASITRRGGPAAIMQNLPGLGDGPHAVFCRRKNHVAAGLSYSVRFSATLGLWEASTATPMVIAEDADVQVVAVPYPALVSGLPARFFQVMVTR